MLGTSQHLSSACASDSSANSNNWLLLIRWTSNGCHHRELKLPSFATRHSLKNAIPVTELSGPIITLSTVPGRKKKIRPTFLKEPETLAGSKPSTYNIGSYSVQQQQQQKKKIHLTSETQTLCLPLRTLKA